MPIQAIKIRRLYQEVASQISDLINEGEFKPGQRLPSERDLSARLEVSRPTIREAMIMLEIQGYVEIRTGSGIYVLEANPSGQSVQAQVNDAGPGPFELIEARLLVEPQAAAIAAQRIGPEILAQLENTIQEMEALNAVGKTAEEPDRRFHLILAEATQNSAIAAMVNMLWEMRRKMPMWQKLHEVISQLEDRPNWTDDRRAVDDHRRILAAIRARDSQRAEDAMRAHLDRVRQTLLEVSEMGQLD